jgi:PAS domain S-box-containing protein
MSASGGPGPFPKNSQEDGTVAKPTVAEPTVAQRAVPDSRDTSRIIGSSEMAKLIRTCDWSVTPLGPLEHWSNTLIAVLNTILASPFPTSLPWGDNLTLLYNDAYRPFLSTKHPGCLGQSFRKVFEEAWSTVCTEFEAALFDGKTSFEPNMLIPIEQDGRLQDNYWLFSLSPVFDEGRIGGVLNVAQNTTRVVHAEQDLRVNLDKQSMLLALSQGQRETDDPEQMMQAAAEAVGRYVGADRTGFLEHEHADGYKYSVSWTAQDGPLPPLSGSLQMQSANAAYLHAWKQGITVVVAETLGDCYSVGSMLVAGGVRARVGVPLMRNGQWYVGFFVQSATPRVWTDAEVALIREAGEQSWDAVERARAALALRQSDARTRRVLESIGDAVIVTDVNACITRMNPVAEQLTGWPEAEVLGRSLAQIFHVTDEATGAAMENPVEKVKRLGTVIGRVHHTVLHRRDGSQLFIDDSGAPIRDEHGQLTGIVLVFRDIGEKRAADRERERLLAEVQRQYAELEATYETAGIAMALVDAKELRYVRVNQQLCDMLALPRDQVLGAQVLEVAPRIAGLAEALESARSGVPVVGGLLVENGAAAPVERRYFTADYAPVLNADGEVVAIAAASAEITQQKKAEAALMQSEKLAAVGRLAASIAHEINNPLESVTNLLYLARATPQMHEAHAYLDLAERELRRASVITNQALQFYKEATRPREVRCEEMIEGVLVIYHGRFISSRVSVEKRKRSKRTVLCFDGEIRQVLSNLVSNAIDAMHPGGGRLLVRSRESTDWPTGRRGIVLTLADTGPGMPRPVVARAFEPFYTTKGTGGTGLGLWISKEIVNRHEGRLQMRTSIRQGTSGTVFTIFLPFDTKPSEGQHPA